MFKLIAALISSFALLWLGLGAGIWWEGYRPAGWPNYQIRVGPIHWTLHLHDSKGAQLAATTANRMLWVRALGQCRENEATLRGAIGRQNAAVAAVGALSARQTAENEKAVQDARAAAQRADAARTALLAQPPAGADTCSRYEDVHRRFTETLP